MGLFDFARRLAGRPVALSHNPDAAPPSIGPKTKRSQSISANDRFVAHREAERLFGPFNPRAIPDRVLKYMSTDWSIGFCREIWLSGFGAVDYFLEGGSAEIRAFLEPAFMPRLPRFREVMLAPLDYGRQTAELVWALEDVAYRFTEAPGEKELERTKAGAYVYADLRDLDPELTEILLDEKQDFAGVRHDGVKLSRDECLHVVNEPEFGDLRGRALNVRAYIPWWRGNFNYLLVDRYLERKGDPPLIGQAGGEDIVDQEGNAQRPEKALAVALANLRSGGSMVIPSEFDLNANQQLYSVRSLEVANRAPEFLQVIDRHEFNKRLAWLIPGQLGSGGSFASDKVAQQLVDRFFDRRLESLVLTPANAHLLPRLVRLNFAGVRPADIPRLCAGNMSSNAREMFAEILRNALTLETILPDGRVAKVAHTIDIMRALKKLNLPGVDPRLIPDAPPPLGLQIAEVYNRPPEEVPPEAPAGGIKPTKSGAPLPGRPPGIAPESNRPNAPGRPGFTGARALAAAASEPAAAYWASVEHALGAIDDRVARAERIAEDHRKAAQEQVRAVMRSRLLQARTTTASDDREVISSRNRKLADEVEREVEAKLERVMNEDLLDEKDLDGASLALARSPLVDQHVGVAREAAGLLRDLGIAAPGAADAKRAIGDIFRDGRRNGQGVVVRETRRVAENVERIVQGGMSPDAAERIVDGYELPRREFVESTVHHVRASARATLAWAGALKNPDQKWVVAVGPKVEAKLLADMPSGEVAGQLYRVFTTRELDDLYAKRAEQGLSVSHWRGLGLNFFSEEMYVPLPADAVLGAAVVAFIAAKRAEWDKRRREAQRDKAAAREPAAP